MISMFLDTLYTIKWPSPILTFIHKGFKAGKRGAYCQEARDRHYIHGTGTWISEKLSIGIALSASRLLIGSYIRPATASGVLMRPEIA